MKLKKGDNIIVRTGRDKGKTGKIERVYPKKNTVLVSGVNVYKKHRKPRSQKDQGGIIDITVPISVSKVALVDPKSGKPTRVGIQVSDKEKTRFAKKSGQII